MLLDNTVNLKLFVNEFAAHIGMDVYLLQLSRHDHDAAHRLLQLLQARADDLRVGGRGWGSVHVRACSAQVRSGITKTCTTKAPARLRQAAGAPHPPSPCPQPHAAHALSAPTPCPRPRPRTRPRAPAAARWCAPAPGTAPCSLTPGASAGSAWPPPPGQSRAAACPGSRPRPAHTRFKHSSMSPIPRATCTLWHQMRLTTCTCHLH